MNHLPVTLESLNLICRADINLDALEQNLSFLKRVAGGSEIVAMVKANAYGHGVIPVARHLVSLGVNWLGVATVEEGIELRKAGVDVRILVMSGAGSHFNSEEVIGHQLTPLLSSFTELEAISTMARRMQLLRPFAVHMDLDTGMSRGGFLDFDAAQLSKYTNGLSIEGVSTHFAKAESRDCPFTAVQIDRFLAKLALIIESGHTPQVVHVDKSASILTHDRHRFKDLNLMVRSGLALYGIDPTDGQQFASMLTPVLSWRAPIVLRKKLAPGDAVGYDCTFICERPTEIALVRIGYADGLKRSLSNHGHLIVGNSKAPILGRVSMDLTVIDVTDAASVEGERVCEVGAFAHVIGGAQAGIKQCAYDLAKLCDTIPYEILTSISTRVKRFT